jgi:hypothetical protein
MEAVTGLGLPAADREVERDGDHAEAEEKDDREGFHTVVMRFLVFTKTKEPVINEHV